MHGQNNSASAMLITGLYRSGTTLLEKLLHAHPEACVASQPFPVFYHFVKQAFLDELGVSRRYPLDHLFLEDAYDRSQWCAFLDRYQLTEDCIDRVFEGLAGYRRGVWTPEMLGRRSRIAAGSFAGVHDQLMRCVGEIFPKSSVRILGAKEILCEEYIPYFARLGVKTVLVIRDPRAVVASSAGGRRGSFAGEVRPTLYTLRCWRKSVAFALAHEGRPGFLWLRYEDMAAAPQAALDRVCSFLSLSPFPGDALSRGIFDQWGRPWLGNSAFGELAGVSPAPAARYLRELPESALAYIESCCLPEMKLMGYPFHTGGTCQEDAIRGFREPVAVAHEKFPSDYSCTEEHVEEEIRRLFLLEDPTAPLPVHEARRWFVHERAYARLRRGLAD